MTTNGFVFLASISIIQGLLLYFLIKGSNYPATFLAVYIALFYMDFEFNTLRAGIAILLLVMANRAVIKNNPSHFYLVGLSAVLIHYSAIMAGSISHCASSGVKEKSIGIAFVLIIVIGIYIFFIQRYSTKHKWLTYFNKFLITRI